MTNFYKLLLNEQEAKYVHELMEKANRKYEQQQPSKAGISMPLDAARVALSPRKKDV